MSGMEIQVPNSAWSGSIYLLSSERELRKIAWNECLWVLSYDPESGKWEIILENFKDFGF